MGRLLVVLIIGIGLLGFVTPEAHADIAGPVCFSTLPFSDTFVWFVQSSGGNQFIGTGRGLPNSTQSVNGFVSGNTAFLQFLTGPGLSGVAVMGGGTLSLTGGSAGTGPGRCVTINSSVGCGTGSNFTFAIITCPAGVTSAPSDTSVSPSTEGPLMDGSK